MGRNRVPPIPLLITAVPLTSLTLIVWIISVVALRQQLPPSTTPPKLSVPTPYLVYVTPAIPAGAEEQKAWFEKVILAKCGLTSLESSSLFPLDNST